MGHVADETIGSSGKTFVVGPVSSLIVGSEGRIVAIVDFVGEWKSLVCWTVGSCKVVVEVTVVNRSVDGNVSAPVGKVLSMTGIEKEHENPESRSERCLEGEVGSVACLTL